MMDVSIIGAGHVGVVTAACLADRGHRVTCVDVDPEKVERIEAGEPPMHEAGLEPRVRRAVDASRLGATTDLAAAVRGSEISILTVGTPYVDGSIDLTAVKQATRDVGEVLGTLDRYHAVVVKSTVVPGTTDDVVAPLLAEASGRRPGEDFGVGMNPEFLREGQAVADFLRPDRIVLGGIDDRTRRTLDELYAVFPDADRLFTSNTTAELIKYTANSLLATLISFSNEIANLAAELEDVDVVEVMEGVQLDRRLSPIRDDGERLRPGVLHYLEAGCGFGGSCFPKDVRALVAHGADVGVPMQILDAVVSVNEQQPGRTVDLLRRHADSLEDVPVAVLGLAFKPGTDDVRESPALPVIQELRDEGARVRAYDPVARENARSVLGDDGVVYAESMEECVSGAEAVVLLTAWDEFGRLPELVDGSPDGPLVVDGRRVLERDRVARYEGIGA